MVARYIAAGFGAAAFCALPAAAQDQSGGEQPSQDQAQSQGQDYPWQPDRPINIVVPWSAGGSTDQVARVAAPLIEEAIGTEMVVVNQPGASGSIGTREVLNSERDGYTWTANAIVDNATYSVTGLIEDTSIDDYRLYLLVANVPLISVTADSEYQDFGQLLEAMKSGDVNIGTAGVNSSGGAALATIRSAAEGELGGAQMVTYDGGNPAVMATASGEVAATTQLAVEQTEMIRSGRLRPLAVLADEPLQVEGIDEVPAITEWLPDIPVAPKHFGILIPTGAPDKVYETVDQIWEQEIEGAEELQQYAAERGAVFTPVYGEEARELVQPAIRNEVCNRVRSGEAQSEPSDLGIECGSGAGGSESAESSGGSGSAGSQ